MSDFEADRLIDAISQMDDRTKAVFAARDLMKIIRGINAVPGIGFRAEDVIHAEALLKRLREETATWTELTPGQNALNDRSVCDHVGALVKATRAVTDEPTGLEVSEEVEECRRCLATGKHTYLV